MLSGPPNPGGQVFSAVVLALARPGCALGEGFLGWAFNIPSLRGFWTLAQGRAAEHTGSLVGGRFSGIPGTP